MKKIVVFLFCISYFNLYPQGDSSFSAGEHLEFKVNYQFINAGYATLDIKEALVNRKNAYHVIGKGYTAGFSSLFFKVNDTYESYIDKQTNNPLQFVRKIDEGGYTKNQEGFFNALENEVLVKDYKNRSEQTFSIPKNTQDILSSFYYLRNHPNIDKMKAGEYVEIDMFFDDSTTRFRLKFIGREEIKTKFGLISTMIFRPLVQTGRIFKEQESLTLWISDDDNKVPIRIKASLFVGAIKADLNSYKGLKYPFKFRQSKKS